MKYWVFCSIILVFGACGGRSTSSHTEESSVRDTSVLRMDAQSGIYEMVKDSVKLHLDEFRELYEKHGDDSSYSFFVNKTFIENNQAEQMWVWLEKINASSFQGILSSEPLIMKKVKYGDAIQVPVSEVKDILVYKNETLILGNYTDRIYSQTSK